MPLSIFSRRKKPTRTPPLSNTHPSQLLQPPGLTSSQSSNALLAAGLAFQNHNPDPRLSSSAAAAALNYGARKSTSGAQLERMGSNTSLMSTRRFRSTGSATKRSTSGDGGSLSSMRGWGKERHEGGGSSDSEVGSYRRDHVYGQQVPPPVPKIPGIYHHQNRDHEHRSWQDRQHAPPRNNVNRGSRRSNGTYTHPTGPGIKSGTTCNCSCHSPLPPLPTYHRDEAEEGYDRISLKSSRRRYPREYSHDHSYNHCHNTYSDEEAEGISLSPRSETSRPLPSASPRRYATLPVTITNETSPLKVASPASPPPKNFFALLMPPVNDKAPPPASTLPTGALKRFPSAKVERRSGSGVGSIVGNSVGFEMLPTPTPSSPDSVRVREERWGSVQSGKGRIGGRGGGPGRQGVIAGAELSPPQSISSLGSAHGNGTNEKRRRRGNGGSTSNNSCTQLTDSIEDITSPSWPAGGGQCHCRGAINPPPPVPALPKGWQEGDLLVRETMRNEVTKPSPRKSFTPIRQQADVDSGDGVEEGEPSTRDAVGSKKLAANGEEGKATSGSECEMKAGKSRYGVKREMGRKVWVRVEGTEDAQTEGLRIFGGGVKIPEEAMADSPGPGEEVGHDFRRLTDTDGSVVLPVHDHHHEVDPEPSRTPPLTRIPEEQGQEQGPVLREDLKELAPILVNHNLLLTEYKEASSASSSSSSSEGKAEGDCHTHIAAKALRERRTIPLTETTPHAPTPPSPPPTVEIPPKPVTPTTETLPPRTKSIMKPPGVKRGGVGDGRGVQFSESASEIEIFVEYEEDSEVERGDGCKLKKKSGGSGGFVSWFRRGRGEGKKEKEKGKRVQKKGRLSRKKENDTVVLGPEAGVAVGGSPPSSTSSLSGELLSPESEGTVRKLSPVPEMLESQPKPEPEHAANFQSKPLTQTQNLPGTGWPQKPESSSSAFTTTSTPTEGYLIGVTSLSPPSPSASRRAPPTCGDTDGGSASSGESIYEDAPEELPPSLPTPVVAMMEDIRRPLSPPPAVLKSEMHDLARPSSSSTAASSHSHINFPPRSTFPKSFRSGTPTSTSTSSTSSITTTMAKNHSLNYNTNRSPSPLIASPSSPRHRYALPPAEITPRTKALIDERRRQIEARKGKGASKSRTDTQSHMRPMCESDTETEAESHWQNSRVRVNGKGQGTVPGIVMNGHGAGEKGGLLSRGWLRSQPPAAPSHPHPHPPPAGATTAKSSFFGFGTGKDSTKEEDKRRLRFSSTHHAQKKFTSRFSKDSDSDSDDESGGFESRFAADSDTDVVESDDVGGEKEIEVRRLMEVIAKEKGIALAVNLDSPTPLAAGRTQTCEQQKGGGDGDVALEEEEESEEELVTLNGTVGGEKDRRMKMKMGWGGVFKKDAGNQANSQGNGMGKRAPLPVMKAGEKEDAATSGLSQEKEESEKEGKGRKFKRIFSRGKSGS